MPDMGGMITLQEIKKIDPKIVVMIVTAVIDEELAKRALQLGADDYITKPLDLKYIEKTVMTKILKLLG
jgi:DNA-binding response OmpR family regulator